MSTHGRMTIKDSYSKKKIHLYAWHDGHTNEALEMLIKLPFTLFQASKNRHELSKDVKTKEQAEKLGKAIDGPWFYDVFKRVGKDRPATRQSIGSGWRSMNAMELTGIGLANWVVWHRFDHWNVIPNLKYASYPGDNPDILINLRSGGSGYNLSVGAEHDQEICRDAIEKALGEVNAKTIDLDAKVKLKHRLGFAPKVYVPFSAILFDLLCQDLVK